jgi:hypothetical protein
MRDFKVGDQVTGQNYLHATWRNGMHGVVAEVLPEPVPRHEWSSDYVVSWSDGTARRAAYYHLRKRPDDQPFSEWFRNTIITDPIAVPLETTMRNVARNLQSFTEGKANGS